MFSLHPGGETRQGKKQDDSKAAILMTCDVWLVMASVACVCFSFDMLFSLQRAVYSAGEIYEICIEVKDNTVN